MSENKEILIDHRHNSYTLQGRMQEVKVTKSL